MDGKFLQNLYVPHSIARGIFEHGSTAGGKWSEGEVRRPAALPYWGHKWGVQAPDGLYLPTPQDPLPDAVSGATPPGAFLLETALKSGVPGKFRVLLEINQAWDWNAYWNNNKFPGDREYATSCQPAVVYATTLDLSSGIRQADLLPIGHSHYAGRDGSLDPDLSTLTTALQIVGTASVQVK
jgi:hypothetical protein